MKYKEGKIIYEVGDWVTSLERAVNQPAGTYQVEYVENDWVHLRNAKFIYMSINYRPATQEEINEALKEDKIFIGEYEIRFFNCGTTKNGEVTTESDALANFCGENQYIKVGCQEVTKETFLKIGKKAGWL